MKIQLLLAVALWSAPVLANTAADANAGHDHAGHDHSAHDHNSNSMADPRERAAAPNESLADYLWRKSDDAFHAGDYERAVGLHRAIVVADPGDVESYSVASWLLWSMGKGDQAIAHLERGLASNPNDPEMWDAAGQHFDLQKKFDRSRESFKKAVELSGSNPDMMLRRRLAHAAEKAGDYPLSIQTWRALAEQFPNDAVAKNNLARVEAESKAAPQARVETASLVGIVGAALMLALPLGFLIKNVRG